MRDKAGDLVSRTLLLSALSLIAAGVVLPSAFSQISGAEILTLQPPVAQAGPDQTVFEGGVVSLDGTGSTDPNPGFLETSAASGNLPGGTALGAFIDNLALLGEDLAIAGKIEIGEGPAVADTAIVYVVDVSGSANFAGGCAGDQNNDGRFDRIIDCEIAAVLELHQEVVTSGTVSDIGLVSFARRGRARDLLPGSGRRFLVDPAADADQDGILDLEESLRALRAGGGTNFRSAVATACNLIAGSTAANRIAVFVTDGRATVGGSTVSILPCDPPVIFENFAIGANNSCTVGAPGSRLQAIADLTGGSCTEVPDVGSLPDILPAIIRSQITGATLSIDGGAPLDVSSQLGLPLIGPDTADFVLALPQLAPGLHEACLTVEAVDAGGESSVTTCSEVTVGPVPLRFAWQLIDADGPPIVLSSSTDPQPSFLVVDDGAYTFELTVTNGVGLTRQDRVTVTVANADPQLDIRPIQGVAGTLVLVSASFTDDGWLDTHSGTIDWGDGSPSTTLTVSTGSGWGTTFASHLYSDPGSYPVNLTLQDDDGGVAAASSAVAEVREPVALWADSTLDDRAIDWAGSSGLVVGRVHSNAGIKGGGSNNRFVGSMEYVTVFKDGGSNIFEPPPVVGAVEPLPVVFDFDDYRPGGRAAVSAGPQYFDATQECLTEGRFQRLLEGTVFEDGLYWIPCDVELRGPDLVGNITLVTTGTLDISGTRENLAEPFIDGLLFASSSTAPAAIDLSLSNSALTGFLYAPGGGVELMGSGTDVFCGILGDHVRVNEGATWMIEGSGCARPDSTTAPPLLVPTLGLSLAADRGTVAPTETIGYNLDLSNEGATLFLTSLVGAQNIDAVQHSVTAARWSLESLDVALDQWVEIAAAGATGSSSNLSLAIQPNASPGVIYPDPDTTFVSTLLEPGAFASWSVAATLTLTPQEVEELLDPARTGGLRVRMEFDFEDPAARVRQLFRFGEDLIGEVRPLTGDLTDAEVTMTLPAGDPRIFTGAEEPGLGLLTPGESVALTAQHPVPALAARAAAETDPAYVNRLLTADGDGFFATAFARSRAGVGLVVAPQTTAQTFQQVPVLEVASTGPAAAVSGDPLDYTVTLTNRGSVQALGISVDDRLEGDPVALTGVPTELPAGGIATATGGVVTSPDDPGGTLKNRAEALWTDSVGNLFGPSGDDVFTELTTPPALRATLTDTLVDDVDLDGLVSPGDVLGYTARLTNTGGNPVTGLDFSLTVDPNSTLVAGSVTASSGTVVTGNSPGDVTVGVTAPSLAGSSELVIDFDVVIAAPLPEGVTDLEVQGQVTSAELAPVATDDPALLGTADPTRTHVVLPEPVLKATLVAAQVLDADGDGTLTPGDRVSYTAEIANDGGGPATTVLVMLPPDPNTTLVVGSVTTTAGTVQEGQDPADAAVEVAVDSLAPEGRLTVTFEVDIASLLPSGVDTISVQGWVASDQLEAVRTDDPATAAEVDATVLILNRPGGDPGGEPGGDPLPAPTVGEITPADGTVVTTPTAVSTTLTPPEGEAIAGWEVSVRRSDAGTDQVVATGTGTLVSTELDPTVLPNGMYQIRVEAEATGGGVSFAETSVVVDGRLKLGRFSVSFLDMAVDLPGLPIQLIRTYDSFDKTIGDFGVGWRLDALNFQVATNGPLGQRGWRQEVVQPGLIFSTLGYFTDRPHFVTVTWPNGFTETFDLTPADGSTFFPPSTRAEFTPRAGATSTLEALNDSLFFIGDGNLYGGAFGSDGIYDPQRFRLTDAFGTAYILDVDSGLVSSRDRNGNTLTVTAGGIFHSQGPSVTFDRDALGRITRITGPDNATAITYGYDANGDLATVSDARGEVADLDYFPDHFLNTFGLEGTPPLRTLTYDEEGRLASITDGAGNTIDVSTDVGIRTEIRSGPDPGLTTVQVFNETGDLERLDEIFDGRVLRTTYEHDERGFRTKLTDPTGAMSEAEYNAAGAVTRFVDRQGVGTRIAYNEFNQPTSFEIGGEVFATYEYGPEGNAERIEFADGSSVTLSYDSVGRLVEAQGRPDRVQRFEYDANGFVSALVDPEGTTRFVNDAFGRPVSVVNPLGATTGVSYDGAGNATSVTDAKGGSRTFAFDGLDRLVREEDELGRSRSATYDAANRVETVTDRNEVVTAFTYGPDDQLVSRTSSDGTVAEEFTYDPAGRLVRAANQVSEIVFEWDDNSNLVRETIRGLNGSGIPEVVLERTTAPEGLALSLTDPFGSTTYTYDTRGRLAGLEDTAAGVFGFSYDELSALSGLTRPNGVEDAFTRDAERLLGQTSSAGGQILEDLRYGYDAFGFLTSLTDSDGVHEYTYDAVGRLTNATHPSASGLGAESYQYDSVGNRVSWNGHPAASVAYDAAHRLLSDADHSYGYDAEGRLVSATEPDTGATTTYRWNALGQLTEIRRPDQSVVSFLYDALGRRIRTADGGEVTHVVHDGLNPRLILDAQGNLQYRLVHGLGLSGILAVTTPAETLYPLSDVLGTVRAVTDGSGAVVERFLYDSFGNPAQESTVPYSTWHGLSRDPTGLYDARARVYDPSIGRFLSEDPLPAVNRYVYGFNSPTLVRDPTGLSPTAEYRAATAQSSRHAPAICGQGSFTAGVFADLAANMLYLEAKALVKVPGIYAFVDELDGRTYVGRTVDFRRRLGEHLRRGRITKNSRVLILQLQTRTRSTLAQVEQLAIRDCGGVNKLANFFNALGKTRRQQLEQLHSTLGSLLGAL